MESGKDLIHQAYLDTFNAEVGRLRKAMESVEASLVKLNGRDEFPYALVPRPLPTFIPVECVVTGEIMVFKETHPRAKIEAVYDYNTPSIGWKIDLESIVKI